MWQLFIAVILVTGLACMVSEPSEPKSKEVPTHVTITRMTGTVWEVDTNKGVYFELIGHSEEFIRESARLKLEYMGYKNLEMKVYL